MKTGDLVESFLTKRRYVVVSGPWSASGGVGRDLGFISPYVGVRPADLADSPDAPTRRITVDALRVVRTAEERTADAVMGEGA